MPTAIYELFDALWSEGTLSCLREVPAMETLRKMWRQNYFCEQGGRVSWRLSEIGIPPSAKFVSSLFDPEVRYARKYTICDLLPEN